MERKEVVVDSVALISVCARLIETMGKELRQMKSMHRKGIDELHRQHDAIQMRLVKAIFWMSLMHIVTVGLISGLLRLIINRM